MPTTPRHGSAARAQRRLIGLPLAFSLAVLHGCASAPTEIERPAEKSQVRPSSVITPQRQRELNAALDLLKAQKYDESIEAFKALSAALPDNPVPLTNLGLAYKKVEKFDLAEQHLKQALVVEPENPVASNELALLYRQRGRFAEARPVYEKVLAKYPHFYMAHKNLGVLCDLYLRDYECALKHYQCYSQGAPDDKNVKIWIADLQKRSSK
jgi:tetratricopeptide (TPR) repeat protein